MTNDEESTSPPRTGTALPPYVLAVAGLLLAAAWLRFNGLTARELWFDENCTFYASHHLFAWPADGPDPRRELGHIPYFVMLHAWTQLAGESIWGLRSFSALMGCVAVTAVGWVGLKMSGRAAGLIAMALAALSPIHLYYSQEARVYTLWTVEITVTLFLLFAAARRLKARWWIAYAAAAWISSATHYYTLFWLPATLAAVLVSSRRRNFLRQWLMTHAVLAVSLLPLVLAFVVPFAEGGPRPWLRQTWLDYPPYLAVVKSIWALLPAGSYPSYLGRLSVASGIVENWFGEMIGHIVLYGPAAFVVVLGYSTIRRVRANSGDTAMEPVDEAPTPAPGLPRAARLAAFLFAISMAFLLLAFSYSALIEPKYIVGRYDLAAWPSMTLGIAALICADVRRYPARGPKRAAAAAISTALLLACSAATIAAARSVEPDNRLADRARRIAAVVDPEDLVISVAMYRWFMEYDWHQLGFHPRLASFPPGHDRQLCWDDAEAELADENKLASDVAQVVSRIRRALTSGKRVWLLAHGEPSGTRWQVDKRFFAGLRSAGIEVRLSDESAGLAELLQAHGNVVETGDTAP